MCAPDHPRGSRATSPQSGPAESRRRPTRGPRPRDRPAQPIVSANAAVSARDACFDAVGTLPSEGYPFGAAPRGTHLLCEIDQGNGPRLIRTDYDLTAAYVVSFLSLLLIGAALLTLRRVRAERRLAREDD